MKRLIITVLALLCFVTALSANPTLSQAEQKALDALFEYRMYVTTLSADAAISGLETYRAQNLTSAKTTGFSEEAKLILDAFVELEELVYYQVKNSEDPKIQSVASAQYDKLQAWIDAHPSETPNKWMYCAAAEAFNWYLAYLPVSQILTKGLLPKQYYEKALEQDPDMVYALCGLGQWLFYAPAIGGGGNKPSKTALEHAAKSAKTNVDKFTAHMTYSQILFETKDKAGASKELDAAEAIQNGSKRIARMRQVNAKGMSWFSFSKEFEANRKKLGEALVN